MSVKLDFSVKPVRSKKPVTQMKWKKTGMKCKLLFLNTLNMQNFTLFILKTFFSIFSAIPHFL